MAELVAFRRQGPAAILTLQRPERRNALDQHLISALRQALAACAADDRVRAVVLTGAGKAFCAGMDIDELLRLQALSAEEQLRSAQVFRDLLLDLVRCPKPLIAAVHGAAYGGGAGLAFACDIAIAGEQAHFACSEVRIGFVPALIAPFVMRSVGARVARDLLLSGRPIDAAEALRLRVVSEVTPDLEASALRWAELLAAGAPASQALTKYLLAAGIEEELTAAVIANAYARRTETMHDGLQAFVEKRPAAWLREDALGPK